MNTQLKMREKSYSFELRSLEDVEKFCEKMAKSSLCPTALKGKPNDVFAIIQTGHEMGLTPTQSIRVLGVFNGMAFAYGDGLTGLAQRHKDWDGIEVWMEGEMEKGTLTAFCTVKRRGVTPVTKQYSMADARKAALLGKPNWANLQRMLQRRAISYAIKDQFADAIMGLLTEEEVHEVAVQSVIKPAKKGLQGLRESVGLIDEKIVEPEILTIKENIEMETTSSLDKLKEMIEKLEVPQKTIDGWLKKAKVEKIEDFTEVQIQKGIAHLKLKEEEHAIHAVNGTGIESTEPCRTW